MQAEASSRRSGRSLEQAPDGRIEWRDGIGPLYFERQRTAGGFIAILHGAVGRALDPFLEPAALDTLEAGQRVAAKGGALADWCTNVGAKHPAVNAHDGIGLRGDVQTPQCLPQQRARGNEAACRV